MADGIRECASSVGRKHGDNSLMALLSLFRVCGKGNSANWRALVVTLTGRLVSALRLERHQIAEMKHLMAHLKYRCSPEPGWSEGKDGARDDFFADKSGGRRLNLFELVRQTNLHFRRMT